MSLVLEFLLSHTGNGNVHKNQCSSVPCITLLLVLEKTVLSKRVNEIMYNEYLAYAYSCNTDLT